MRSFSNIMPNFAVYLHLLVDSIISDFSCLFTNKCQFLFVFSIK